LRRLCPADAGGCRDALLTSESGISAFRVHDVCMEGKGLHSHTLNALNPTACFSPQLLIPIIYKSSSSSPSSPPPQIQLLKSHGQRPTSAPRSVEFENLVLRPKPSASHRTRKTPRSSSPRPLHPCHTRLVQSAILTRLIERHSSSGGAIAELCRTKGTCVTSNPRQNLPSHQILARVNFTCSTKEKVHVISAVTKKTRGIRR